MAKYYCGYCKSYLTHDSISVRKSHLLGKNHLKFYADYYENVSQLQKREQLSKQSGTNNATSEPVLPWEFDENGYFKGMPGLTSSVVKQDEQLHQHQNSQLHHSEGMRKYDSNGLQHDYKPPPPILPSLPFPPPSAYHYNLAEEKKKLYDVMRKKR